MVCFVMIKLILQNNEGNFVSVEMGKPKGEVWKRGNAEIENDFNAEDKN